MSEVLVYRAMVGLAALYGSALLSQFARFLLPVLPDKFAIALLVIAVLGGAIAFIAALYQGRDKSICYSVLACSVTGLIIGGAV
jgi:hypothetical protein